MMTRDIHDAGLALVLIVLGTLGACSSNGPPGSQYNATDTGTESISETGTNSGTDPYDPDDVDGDGWKVEWDCNDRDADVSPGHPEVPANGIDDDCDGDTDESDVLDPDKDIDTEGPYPDSVDAVFNVGSLLVPMDVDYQDDGMLQAYGLVYQLLLAKVEVHWLIRTPKLAGEADFVASAQDVATRSAVTEHGYRGGPFAIAAQDAPRALAVVEAWQASHVTTVHQVRAKFVGPVARTLRQTPRIGILANGEEDISFRYMRAAGIPDSLGQEWPDKKEGTEVYSGYPDILSVAEVRGPTDTNDRDGALFDDAGQPAFCELMTMHWNVRDRDEEAIAEIREYLSFPVHFFAACQSVNAVENALNGHFLTPAGYVMDKQPVAVDILNPYLPFSQIDGAFETVGGSEPSYSLPEGHSYYDDGVVMVTEAGTPLGHRDVWMTGYLDGACKIDDVQRKKAAGPQPPAPGSVCPGKISYLAGHEYSTQTPISANPDTQGTRFFLNALFEADCVTRNP